ncbi:fructuronate reductase [Haloactinopolyspora alba]|uniref:Fructuronate reductase n=1 Tax=Haloactinopolyspora alba TaxID=648780 RepID=A0A2P8DFX4_9ACTN|nr:mannitol dehydrogenase family protein [Haloactinopolyspora alba]PSK96115.1 fructuronate reductase [Haloactinopolyspora alba]
MPPVLSRRSPVTRPAAPIRIAHLGLGNFFRAHQAWYTGRAPDSAHWGIAAFTGRRPALADALRPQDGLYTLVTRGPVQDRFDVVTSLSAVHAAADHAAWLDVLHSPDLAVVTLTVTEAGYARAADGSLDATDDAVRNDVAALRGDLTAPVSTAPARLLAGLAARDRAGLGAIAIVPCDNLPDNGPVTAHLVREMAELVDPALVAAVDRTAAFATSMVDRITPRVTDDDRAIVRSATGVDDAAPVVTEPFSEWVVSGRFPAGRPRWEDAGVTVVDDVAPFEQRKLWLLNGGHSLLAYGASLRRHETVAEAVADPVCRGWLEQWWDEAAAHLSLPAAEIESYRAALLERFANPRIRHLLAQIAADGSAKLPVRILPTLRAERAAGRMPAGAARALAAWICHLRGHGAAVRDADGARARAAAGGPVGDAVPAVLTLLDASLGGDRALVDAVTAQVDQLTELTG